VQNIKCQGQPSQEDSLDNLQKKLDAELGFEEDFVFV